MEMEKGWHPHLNKESLQHSIRVTRGHMGGKMSSPWGALCRRGPSSHTQYLSGASCCLRQCAEELEVARGEIRRLQAERERVEESMKKAFMRGVCALNMEAMSVFQGAETRPDHGQCLERVTHSHRALSNHTS